MAHVTEAPRSPRGLNPQIPAAVETEILRVLEKDPAKRHKNARGFINAIRRGYGLPIMEARDTREMQAFHVETFPTHTTTPTMPESPTFAVTESALPVARGLSPAVLAALIIAVLVVTAIIALAVIQGR
jgi:hypothetical protein